MRDALRALFTADVVRAVAALRQQQNVARQQDGKTVVVTGTEAAQEYLIETAFDALNTLLVAEVEHFKGLAAVAKHCEDSWRENYWHLMAQFREPGQ